MLRLFFNKESPVVTCLEVIGVTLSLWLCCDGTWWIWDAPSRTAFGVILGGYGFLRYCAMHRWYPQRTERYLGIEIHFKKAVVPAAYLMTIVGLWLRLGGSPRLLFPVAFLFVVILHVNWILLYFHARDRDPTPVNAYSRPGSAREAGAVGRSETTPVRRAVGS